MLWESAHLLDYSYWYCIGVFWVPETMLSALTAIVGAIFVLFFAPNLQTLLVDEILMGLPVGVFQTLTVTYTSEVSPVVLRCYLIRLTGELS